MTRAMIATIVEPVSAGRKALWPDPRRLVELKNEMPGRGAPEFTMFSVPLAPVPPIGSHDGWTGSTTRSTSLRMI